MSPDRSHLGPCEACDCQHGGRRVRRFVVVPGAPAALGRRIVSSPSHLPGRPATTIAPPTRGAATSGRGSAL